MRYVILRDDDTNALTPVECLEQLYRPFLDRGLPVNLAVIPNVSTTAKMPDGRPEGFLREASGSVQANLPIGGNAELVEYLLNNRGFEILQHGFQHDLFEFESLGREETEFRMESGTQMLLQAGFARPRTFVAPYDRFSRTSLRAAAGRFAIVSTGWFELGRIPRAWWPGYLRKKLLGAPHWQADGCVLLSHPGCLLSAQRPRDGMVEEVRHAISERRVTVLVTHWWEYFPNGRPDADFIRQLHAVAEFLEQDPDVHVISFSDLLDRAVQLN
jgi:hypothetical protein